MSTLYKMRNYIVRRTYPFNRHSNWIVNIYSTVWTPLLRVDFQVAGTRDKAIDKAVQS